MSEHFSARVLFILKKNHAYSSYSGGYGSGPLGRQTGLFYSAEFLRDMLQASHIPAKVVEVNDNNDIDGAVQKFKPTHVSIEAYWVVPEKFNVLTRLHPHIKWIVRCHSEVTFLAQEEITIKWTKLYVAHKNVYVAANSGRTTKDIQMLISETYPSWTKHEVQAKVFYLPDYYPDLRITGQRCSTKSAIKVGSFGSIRPLKNLLTQAFAAMTYARAQNKTLVFYVNNTVEQGGESVLASLRALFVDTKHCLVEIPWLDRPAFMHLIGSMDLEMAVSYTETFCLVAADAVSSGVPVVSSASVPWAARWSIADPNSVLDIVKVMGYVLGRWSGAVAKLNYNNLRKFSKNTKRDWLDYLSK